MALKKCLGGCEKDEVEFALDKSRVDGRCPYCKECRVKQEGDRRRKVNELKRLSLTTRCAKCGKDKPKEEFAPRRLRHRRSIHCLECRQLNPKYSKTNYHRRKDYLSLYSRSKRLKLKTELVLFAGGKCKDCQLELSDEWPVVCFDFHHRNPEEKKFTISHELKSGIGKQLLIEEVKKCDLLCANCHRRRHYRNVAAVLSETDNLLKPK